MNTAISIQELSYQYKQEQSLLLTQLEEIKRQIEVLNRIETQEKSILEQLEAFAENIKQTTPEIIAEFYQKVRNIFSFAETKPKRRSKRKITTVSNTENRRKRGRPRKQDSLPQTTLEVVPTAEHEVLPPQSNVSTTIKPLDVPFETTKHPDIWLKDLGLGEIYKILTIHYKSRDNLNAIA